MTEKPGLESKFERSLFASRWLMAPMYLGLAIALGMLTVIFVKELIYYLPQIMELSAEKMILVALTLIDLTLAANLLLIVMFSATKALSRSSTSTWAPTGRAGWARWISAA